MYVCVCIYIYIYIYTASFVLELHMLLRQARQKARNQQGKGGERDGGERNQGRYFPPTLSLHMYIMVKVWCLKS